MNIFDENWTSLVNTHSIEERIRSDMFPHDWRLRDLTTCSTSTDDESHDFLTANGVLPSA